MELILVALAAVFAIVVVTTAMKDGQMKGTQKKKRETCVNVPDRPDLRIECPKCGVLAVRRVIRTYTQPNVAVHRYDKCSCGKPFRQSDRFSARI
jgi:hypothetical protein